jgi:hypothetical protein
MYQAPVPVTPVPLILTVLPFVDVAFVFTKAVFTVPTRVTTLEARVIVPAIPSTACGATVMILFPAAPWLMKVYSQPAIVAGSVIVKASVATRKVLPESAALNVTFSCYNLNRGVRSTILRIAIRGSYIVVIHCKLFKKVNN